MQTLRFTTLLFESLHNILYHFKYVLRFQTLLFQTLRFQTLRFQTIRFQTLRFRTLRFQTDTSRVSVTTVM